VEGGRSRLFFIPRQPWKGSPAGFFFRVEVARWGGSFILGAVGGGRDKTGSGCVCCWPLPSQRLWLRAYNWCCGRGWQQLGGRRRAQARSDRLLAVAPARVGRLRSPPPQSLGIPIWGFARESERPKSIAGTENGGALEEGGTQSGSIFHRGPTVCC